MPVNQINTSLEPSSILYTPASSGASLIDATTIMHGPRQKLSMFFLGADAFARQIGVKIRVQTDMSLLADINTHLSASWRPLGPMFNPAHSDLSPANAFWLSVLNHEDRLIATYGCRLIETGPGGFADELRSLRLYYRDPTPHIEKGARFILDEPAASVAAAVIGRVNYVGGTWVDPEHRKRGLPLLLGRIGRLLAMARWNTDYVVSLLRINLAASGVLEKYGYPPDSLCSNLRLENSYTGNLDLHFVWMHRDANLADMVQYTERFSQAA